MLRQVLAKICLLAISGPLFSQVFPAKDYPRHYFRDPLSIPIRLVANFGELRPNHYHMGLDIRTEGRANLPVYAAADGYIARVKIEPEGFGQAIYINHPNGFTSLYAHLNVLFPALAEYVKRQQYKMESWKIYLDIPPGMFPVKKGDLIALSGSTGGAEGPHLHFEIRSTAGDINLNPMLFGLKIPDNKPPVIQRLAMYDRTKSIYEQTPVIFPVKRADADYSIAPAIISTDAPTVGFAISAFDTQSGSSNPNGIYQAVLYDNDHPILGFQLDSISYNDTRDINAHIDYKTKANGGPYLQQLFELPGSVRSIYKQQAGNGDIDIANGSVHAIRVEVSDAHGNRAELHFKIRYRQKVQRDSVFPGKLFYPLMLDGYESDECAFYIGESCLYDSVHIQYTRSTAATPDAVSALHRIGAAYIPLRDPFLVRIKSSRSLTGPEKDRVVMQRRVGNNMELSTVQWQGDWASARFRDFGNFQLVLDEKPPAIVALGLKDGANLSKSSKIAFIIKDNLGSYKNFRAELDGGWLLFTHDKARAFIYTFDEHCRPGVHKMKVSVEDMAGNKTVRVYTFTR